MEINNTSNSLVPAFKFGVPNERVLLAKDTVSITVDGNVYDGNGDVWLELLPRAGIYIYAEFQEIPPLVTMRIGGGEKEITSFAFGKREFPGDFVELGGDVSNGKMTLKWSPESEPLIGVGDDATSIHCIVFHLFNFKDITGSTTNIIELAAGSWKVELRSLVETPDCFKKLKSEGGYGLTHIGCLKKPDGSSFSGKEAGETLDALRLFFSFAKGISCEPICAVGFDNSNTRVWESWSSPREPWYSPTSWLDQYHCEQLPCLFPGFMRRWEDGNWRDALYEVIYWYLNSNYHLREIDTGIILTQVAIERISYEYAVKHRKLIEAKGFNKLKASDQFRLLFSSLDIPLDISTATPEMIKLAKQFNWLDAPHAMTEVRNSLIHPVHRRINSALIEVWKLGLWYLELTILRICGYDGTYNNRLVSEVEDVPWKRRD